MTAPWLLAMLALLGACACAHVPVYDRGKLAHPTMLPGYTASPGRAHMQEVQEGATGGDSSTSSGCGCN